MKRSVESPGRGQSRGRDVRDMRYKIAVAAVALLVTSLLFSWNRMRDARLLDVAMKARAQAGSLDTAPVAAGTEDTGWRILDRAARRAFSDRYPDLAIVRLEAGGHGVEPSVEYYSDRRLTFLTVRSGIDGGIRYATVPLVEPDTLRTLVDAGDRATAIERVRSSRDNALGRVSGK